MSTPLEKWSVTTPPTEAPVSREEAIAHLRLDNDIAQESVIDYCLAAATDYAQDELGMSLMPQTLTAIFNAEDVELTPPVRDYPWDPLSPLGTPLGTPAFATWGTYNRSPVVRLPRGPVSAIVSAVDGSGNAITQYSLERTPRGDRMRFMGTSVYPVVIVYQAGYANACAIPAAIRLAILAHVGTLYKNRESANASGAKVVPHSLEAFYRLKSRRVCVG